MPHPRSKQAVALPRLDLAPGRRCPGCTLTPGWRAGNPGWRRARAWAERADGEAWSGGLGWGCHGCGRVGTPPGGGLTVEEAWKLRGSLGWGCHGSFFSTYHQPLSGPGASWAGSPAGGPPLGGTRRPAFECCLSSLCFASSLPAPEWAVRAVLIRPCPPTTREQASQPDESVPGRGGAQCPSGQSRLRDSQLMDWSTQPGNPSELGRACAGGRRPGPLASAVGSTAALQSRLAHWGPGLYEGGQGLLPPL